MRLPARWRLKVDGVLVAPVPEPSTHLFARAVGLYRARLSPEQLLDPQYAPNHPGWANRLADDHEQHLQAYTGPAAAHEAQPRPVVPALGWRTLEDVVTPYCMQAVAGTLPASKSYGYSLFHRGEARVLPVEGVTAATVTLSASTVATVIPWRPE